MNTATRALVAFFAPVLVAGTAVAATAASASAAPGTVEATPASVCAALGGDYADYEGGSWDCYYPDIDAASEGSLAAAVWNHSRGPPSSCQRGGHLGLDDVLLPARADQLNRYVVWPWSSPNTRTFEGRTRNTWAPPSVLPPESVSS